MKNETAKITDYIWYVMHVDVQGWKERRGGGEEESDVVLEVTQKQLKRERESHSWKKSTRETSAHHDVNRAGGTLPTTTS